MKANLKKLTLVVSIAAAFAAPAHAADVRSTQGGVKVPAASASRVTTPQVDRTVNDMRAIVKQSARNHIETSTHQATNGRLGVTDRDRPASSPIASSAHDRGAVDFSVRRSRDPHADAAAIARRVGPGHTVIVEQPRRHTDVHTSYKVQPPMTDVRVNSYTTPPRARGEHIHVQPNYGIRPTPRLGTGYIR